MSELRQVPVDAIEPDPQNPQIEDVKTFRDLVDGIREFGFVEPVTLVRLDEFEETPARLRIVAGEHRWKAAKVLGIREIPALIVDAATWDEAKARVQMIRSNMVRGSFDAVKFGQLWADLERQYGAEALRKMVGGSSQREIDRMVGQIARALPTKQRNALQKRREAIRSADDVAAVVQGIVSEHGATLDHGFVIFAFGRQTHLMVRCTPETFAPIKQLAEQAERQGWQLDHVLAWAVQAYMEPPVKSELLEVSLVPEEELITPAPVGRITRVSRRRHGRRGSRASGREDGNG